MLKAHITIILCLFCLASLPSCSLFRSFSEWSYKVGDKIGGEDACRGRAFCFSKQDSVPVNSNNAGGKPINNISNINSINNINNTNGFNESSSFYPANNMMDNRGNMRNMDAIGGMGMGGNNIGRVGEVNRADRTDRINGIDRIDGLVEGQDQNEPSAEDILLQLKSMRDGGNPINDGANYGGSSSNFNNATGGYRSNDGNAMRGGYQDYQNNYNYPADQQSNQQLKPWEENPAWKNEMPPDPSLERIKKEIGW